MQKIVPAILCGGSGTRLWPLSTPDKPKQFLHLVGSNTLLQDTCLRVAPTSDARFDTPIITCQLRHEDLAREQLAEVGVTAGSFILEPTGRNSAPAIAMAAIHLEQSDPDAIILALPADHAIPDAVAFRESVLRGLPAARAGKIVTLGIRPTKPETGYGYIAVGDDGEEGSRQVRRFVEKPNQATAEAYVADGGFLWNAGIFLFSVRTMLQEFASHQFELLTACRAAYEQSDRSADRVALDSSAFGRCTSISIDYAIMEKSASTAVVPVDFAWSDLGSWAAVWEISERDGRGNAVRNNVSVIDVSTSLAFSPSPTAPPRVVLVGVDDVIVVVSHEHILVTKRSRAEDVRLAATLPA